MQNDYKRFYENSDPAYYNTSRPQPIRQPQTGNTFNKKKSYKAHIIIPIIMLIFVISLQIIFGVFDVLFPERISGNAELKGNRRYVSITLDEVNPTGYRMMSDSNILGNVYYCFIDGHCLFLVLPRSDAKGSAPLRDYTLLGRVQSADATISGLLDKISGDLKLTSASLSGSSYPFILSHVPTYVILDLAIAVLLIITVLISFIVLVYGITRSISTHDML